MLLNQRGLQSYWGVCLRGEMAIHFNVCRVKSKQRRIRWCKALCRRHLMDTGQYRASDVALNHMHNYDFRSNKLVIARRSTHDHILTKFSRKYQLRQRSSLCSWVALDSFLTGQRSTFSKEAGCVRTSLNRRRPFGEETWTDEVVERHGLWYTMRPVGRPRT